MDPSWSNALFLPLVLGGAVLLAVVLALLAARALVHVCRPNEVLIFAGRTHRAGDGGPVGFRVVSGGRAIRIPLLEKVERMDVSLLSVPMTVTGAYSLGGIPLTVQAVANVKVSSEPQVLGNALERFLGLGRDTIAEVARETLEGHLRGVLATMTPEQVNEDRLTFADRLTEEAGEDLRQLGLQLDTLKIQHVSDERLYLDSIGRVRIAEVLREAEVAESDAAREAQEAEAASEARAQVAAAQAEARIQQHHHALAEQRAGLEAQARSEEERALAAAEEARAEAEKALQEVRAAVEELRLRAEVIVPAEARRRARELEAAGAAAPVAENGRATAEALALVSQAWRETGGTPWRCSSSSTWRSCSGRWWTRPPGCGWSRSPCWTRGTAPPWRATCARTPPRCRSCCARPPPSSAWTSPRCSLAGRARRQPLRRRTGRSGRSEGRSGHHDGVLRARWRPGAGGGGGGGGGAQPHPHLPAQ